MKEEMVQNIKYKVALFDLGGVLIELSGINKMIEWTNGSLTIKQIFDKWLSSSTVRKFETGRSDSLEFAIGITDEFNLPIEPQQFINEFSNWNTTCFPNTISLLEQLSKTMTIASLSNTNKIHWDIVCNQLQIDKFFHYNFPSHEIGLLKPDKEVFEHVINKIGCEAKEIVFFDDNKVNVESANSIGINSFVVSSIDKVISILIELNCINFSENQECV